MPDSDWESLCAQDCCDAFRFEIADLALRHLKAHQLLHHTQRICTGLKKVFSAPECAAVALLFALVLESLSTCLVSPALLRGLGALNYRAHEWLRPSASQKRVAGRAKCELWTWLLGVSRWLLLTAWQLHAGSRRRKVARRRLQFLPEAVRNSVQTGWWPPVAVPKAFDAFVSLQVSEPLKPQCLDAVVYIVGGRHKEVYVGYSSHMRASKSARLGAPVPRVNEHFYEASCVDRCGAACAKSRLLKLESPCDLGALVVFAGPDLQARAFEKTLIASLQPALNTLWHGPTMGRPSLANKARDSFGAASRRRPHKHARQVGQAGLTEGPRDDEISRLVQVDVRRRAGQIRAKARETVSISLLSRPFPVMYALCLAAHVQEHGTYGPVNVFGQLSHLLVAWICYRPAVMQWQTLLKQPRGYQQLFKLYDLLKLVPTSGRRKLGLRRLQFALRLAGEPPARTISLKVPPELGLSAARLVLRQCAQTVSCHCPARWAWMRKHIKLSPVPGATFAGSGNNQSEVSRSCDVRGLRAKPAAWKSSAICGHDLVRVKKYWKLPHWRDFVTVSRTFVSDVCDWLQCCRQQMPSNALCGTWVDTACAAASKEPVMSDEFAHYTADMTAPAAGEALVVEDKDNATLWRQDAECYVFRLDALMHDDSKHWQPTGLSPEAALEGMRSTFDWASKHCSIPRFSRSRWFKAGLPYVFGSVKSKCYKTFSRTCVKPAHSCYRKIVSWFWHPGKQWLRRCNRAVLATVRLLKPGFTASSLKFAVAELLDACLDLAVPDQEHECKRCGRDKSACEVCVMDSEAMFESMNPKDVNVAVEALAQELCGKGIAGVVVPSSRQCKRKPFFARSLHLSIRGMRVVSVQDMVVGTALTLAQRFVRLGNTVWRQCAGTPIGGICSTSSADACLSHIEQSWLENPGAREEHGYAYRNLPWSKLVAQKRYVDDLCIVSRHFCRRCLSELPSAIYPSWISWDEASGEATFQAWLDVYVHTGQHGVRVVPLIRDEPFLRGESSEPVKFAMAPFLGRSHVNFDMLHSHVCAKVARWEQLRLDPDALVSAVAGEAAVWLKYGYPPKLIETIWAKQQRLPHISCMMRAIMQRAGRC